MASKFYSRETNNYEHHCPHRECEFICHGTDKATNMIMKLHVKSRHPGFNMIFVNVEKSDEKRISGSEARGIIANTKKDMRDKMLKLKEQSNAMYKKD